MKDVIGNRIKRIEQIIKSETKVSMIATQDKDGFHWNGGTYTNKKELSAAIRLTVGDYWDVPLIILSKIHADVTGGHDDKH